MLAYDAISTQAVGTEGQSSGDAPKPPPADIDATKIPAARTVVFEGSTRTVAFEGGVRTVSFEGSKRTVKF